MKPVPISPVRAFTYAFIVLRPRKTLATTQQGVT